MCQLLGVSPSGYYAWKKRQPSQRSQIDAALIAEIQVAHTASRGTYGAPLIHAELAAKGSYIGRKRVARLMRQAGLAGVSRRRFVRHRPQSRMVAGRRRTWSSATLRRKRLIGCGSLTSPSFRPGRGFSISPSCSMRIAVALSAGQWPRHTWPRHSPPNLVLDALNMALATRLPRAVILHSDQGSQGGFKWSSQHIEEGVCDDHSEAAFG